MKKLLLAGLIIGASTLTVAQDKYVETRIGLNTFGAYSFDGHNIVTKHKTEGVGVDFAVELMSSVNDNLYLGGGMAYQVNQDSKVTSDPLFKSVPIYGAIKYNLGYVGDSAWVPYIKANLGYSFNMKDGGEHTPKDGLYWALGAGVENDGVILEAAYQDTYSEIRNDKFDYSRWTFSIGYRFKNL